MSNNTDTVRVYFPADIPKDQVVRLCSLFTGGDDDVLLDVERAVNGRLAPLLTDEDEFYDKVEFSDPLVLDSWFVSQQGDKLIDLYDPANITEVSA